MDKKTWGGKRPNAGRKKVGNAVLYCSIPKDALDAIKNAAKEENLAVGTYLVKRLGL
uniref:NikA, BACTERIAL CONJUGATION, RELAXASE, DNA n=1 Tax=Siphoviridae sp. ct13O11 TaxID=2825303 RepID=A0A8S5UD77_9CAUD|nr:MAG TPA: NikA, BACTERIAL CONJUGATION, RELAXASE, DNA [Siphoviridae sp. ct13O11]